MKRRPFLLYFFIWLLLIVSALFCIRSLSQPQPTPTISPTASATPTSTPIQNITPTPSSSATVIATATPAPTLPLKISLEGRAKDKYKLGNVKVTVKDAQSGQELVSNNDETISDAGDVSISGNFSTGKTYKVTIKAPGFLQAETEARQSITSTLPAPLAVGDFDGDNRITVADIVSVIAAHNGASRPEVVNAFAKVPDLPEIVQVIRNSNVSH